MTIFDDNFWWQFLMTIFDDNFWWHFLMTIFRLLENFQIFGFFSSDFLKILWPDTWHLRHWLHCWQLRTTILTITLWPLNKEWQWQHSQCFHILWTEEELFQPRRTLLCPPDLPGSHCPCHQLDGFQSTCWGDHRDNCDDYNDDNDDELLIGQHIRQQYEAGHRLVAKVLTVDNGSFTQVHIILIGRFHRAWLLKQRFSEINRRISLRKNYCSALRPGSLPGSTWWESWRILLTGFCCYYCCWCCCCWGFCWQVFPPRPCSMSQDALAEKIVSDDCFLLHTGPTTITSRK